MKEVADNNGKFRVWRVIDISIAHFVHDVYSSFLAPILPLLIDKLGLSYFLASTLPLFGRIPSALNFLIGLIAEKTAIRYFIIVTPAITTISMSLIGLSRNNIAEATRPAGINVQLPSSPHNFSTE